MSSKISCWIKSLKRIQENRTCCLGPGSFFHLLQVEIRPLYNTFEHLQIRTQTKKLSDWAEFTSSLNLPNSINEVPWWIWFLQEFRHALTCSTAWSMIINMLVHDKFRFWRDKSVFGLSETVLSSWQQARYVNTLVASLAGHWSVHSTIYRHLQQAIHQAWGEGR